jgi:hypothetical protein
MLWVAVTLYFPDSRQWLLGIVRPVWSPVVRWNAKEEMKQVGKDLVANEALTGKLPEGRGWLEWLDYRYATDETKQDPWGSTYQLRVWADSVAVISYGPDRTAGTDDDLQVSQPRQRPKR